MNVIEDLERVLKVDCERSEGLLIDVGFGCSGIILQFDGEAVKPLRMDILSQEPLL